MKSLKCIVLLSLFFLISCKKNKTINTDKTVIEDSISSKENTTKESLEIDDSPSFKVSENCNEIPFESFFERFGRDSIFQKKRVKYPLKYLSSEYDFDKRKDTISVDFILNKEEFSFIDFAEDKNAMEKEFDKYTVNIEDLDSVINYRLNGYDNGMRITHKFKLIDGCWFMIEILDEST